SQKDRWTDSPQELSIPGISSKRPLSKGIAHLPRPQSRLKIFTTSSKKEKNHYTRPGSGIMTCYTSALLMTSIVIKRMTSRNIGSSSSNDGLAAFVNKLDNLGRDMKKLKESVHAIQVGCKIYEGPHLDKDYPLNKEVKQVEEVRYGEFERTTPFNKNNGGKFRVGPPGYYTKTDNRPPYGERRQSLEELLAKHQEESAQRSTEMEEENNNDQLPTKESNPRHFTLPVNLRASVNVLLRNIFEYLKLTNLSETEMLVEMVDIRKKEPLGIVRDILVKIDKFLFSSDFAILDQTPNSTVILGRPFLATVHVQISVFEKEISVGIGYKRVKDSVWSKRYLEWCNENSHDEKPRPRDYTSKEWVKLKKGHLDISKSLRKDLFRLWVIYQFTEALDPDKDPLEICLDEYNWNPEAKRQLSKRLGLTICGVLTPVRGESLKILNGFDVSLPVSHSLWSSQSFGHQKGACP
ncbi:zinc knuckle CX2CX4HX4C containing protein, partial [Tanacetum coccineum]